MLLEGVLGLENMFSSIERLLEYIPTQRSSTASVRDVFEFISIATDLCSLSTPILSVPYRSTGILNPHLARLTPYIDRTVWTMVTVQPCNVPLAAPVHLPPYSSQFRRLL